MKFTVHFYKFYELGTEYNEEEIKNYLGDLGTKSPRQYHIHSDKEEPEYVSYPEPLTFFMEETLQWQEQEINIQGKFYRYGALSLRVIVPLDVEDFDQLNKYMRERNLQQEAERLFDDIYQDIEERLPEQKTEKYYEGDFSISYPVFCVSDTEYRDVGELIIKNKREITALLSGMHSNRYFSDEQVDNVLRNQSRFYDSDYSIIHWNGALTVDNKADYFDTLFIIELANIQFLKLHSYDQYIDNYLGDYLGRVRKTFKRRVLLHIPGLKDRMREITRMRVEIEKISEMMDNFEKFFGKWYLAKIYYLASNAFEIPRWRKLLESRIDKVNELYTMLHEEVNRSRMLILNFLTFLLFVLWFVTG